MPRYSIETIGDLIDRDHTLRVHCEAQGCHHHGIVDLERLAAKLGRDHSYLSQDIERHFRCSKCGSERVGFFLSPGGGGGLYSPPFGS